jgi:transposase-like protein
MANGAKTLAEVREGEWTRLIKIALLGLLGVIVASLLLYGTQWWFQGGWLVAGQVIFGLSIFAGAAVMLVAGFRALQTRLITGVTFLCPYCDAPNEFIEQPTVDFDCESCNRTVHFIDGEQVPVHTIVCQSCGSEHRVAANVPRYVCDRCNRPLAITTDTSRRAPANRAEEDALLQNYDVLLVSVDRRHENEVALKLQNLLVTTLPEARRLMGTASAGTPLVVGHELPLRKAEAVRRQLQEMGATVTLRPTTMGTRTVPRSF